MKKWITILILSSTAIVLGWFIFFNERSNLRDANAVPEKISYNFHVRPILSDKCFKCHGPDKGAREAKLRLDVAEIAFAELNESPGKYAIVPGKPDESELISRIHSADPEMRMPPVTSNLKLNEVEVEILTKWVKQGAKYENHWAFLKPKIRKTSEGSQWAKDEIDNYIWEKLNEKGLEPGDEADRLTLLKRASFDLTGLPPDSELKTLFLKDKPALSYEELLDRLLESKHFGEKWAVPWLDVARYADSHGYQDDGYRSMWPWRDWVIHALNENYSYEKFVTWQLAGDLVENKNKETVLATGFNRNHKITQEGGVIDEEYRVEYVTDRTNTFGKAFLGLTFECAKCHDHKYDPISMEEYYSTFAFFDKVPEKGLYGTIDASFADPPNMRISLEDIEEYMDFINMKDRDEVDVMVMKDSIGIRETYMLERGNYDAKGKVVEMSTPYSIMEFDENKYAKNRLGLAQWLFDEDNPLTSRVFVNRVWQELFGRGLVGTPGDFGMQGELPTHPELLDYLAVDFRQKGWDIKGLIKKIMMSATYRQTSIIDDNNFKLDPENLWYSRMSRKRMAAETIRDHILASSGLLNREIGGPSVKPYQPEGLWNAATSGRGTLQRYIQDNGDDLYRRGIYTFIKRTVPPPGMLVFDASNRDQCEVRRLETNTPLQALIMMNDPTILEASRVMAQREYHSNIETAIINVFEKIVCRYPESQELDILLGYFEELKAEFSNHSQEAKNVISVGEYENIPSDGSEVEIAAFMEVIQVIYNMEEVITIG